MHAHARRTSTTAVVARCVLVTPSASTKCTRRITSSSSRLVEQSSQQTNRHPLATQKRDFVTCACGAKEDRRRATHARIAHRALGTPAIDIVQRHRTTAAPATKGKFACMKSVLVETLDSRLCSHRKRRPLFTANRECAQSESVKRSNAIHTSICANNNFILFLIEANRPGP